MHTMTRLENASHVQRVGSLTVSKHLINSKSLNKDNVANIVNLINGLLTDPNSKVVKSVTQVIVALCHNNHLDAQTGAPFISYLVKHCAGGCPPPPERRNSLSAAGEESVGEVCSRALNLLATTISPAVPILWPHLLLYVCGTEHEASLPTVLSCLAHLASLPNISNQEDDEEEEKKDQLLLSGAPGPPTPAILLTRLLVLSSSPDYHNIGSPSLLLLKGISRHISPKVTFLWEERLPSLLRHYQKLTSIPDPTSQQSWQEELRTFLADTIIAIQCDDMTRQLAGAVMDQLGQNDKHQGRRCFLMSLLGASLQHCQNKTFVAITLDSLYAATNHKSWAEQESFSLALGLCAATHTDLTLTHLEGWLKTADPVKKTLSFFSLIKQQDPRLEEATWIKASIVMALGQISALTPADVIGSKVDGPIMLHLLNIINSNKSDLVNDVVLQTISKISKSLVRLQGYKLRQRPLLITHLVNTIQHENVTVVSLASTLQALRDLTALEPVLNVEERTIILQASLSSSLKKLIEASVVEVEDGKLIESTIFEAGLVKCYSQLNVLIRTIIQKDTNPAVLDDVTTLLHSWTISHSQLVRAKVSILILNYW